MSNLTKKRIVEISIPSELGFEKIPISAVTISARKMGFAPERIENLKMAMGEAVTNAIEHGNQLDVGAEVFISLIAQDKTLILIVIDQGQQPIPDIPAERKDRPDNRGWGMPLIKKFMDEVTTVAAPGRNEIKMVAHLER